MSSLKFQVSEIITGIKLDLTTYEAMALNLAIDEALKDLDPKYDDYERLTNIKNELALLMDVIEQGEVTTYGE